MSNGDTGLIAYDGSSAARVAVERAAQLLALRRAIVVSVWTPMAEMVSASLLALPATIAREAAEAIDRESELQAQRLAQEAADLAGAAGMEARAEAARCIGNVWSTILAVADREDAGAVVVGSRGRSGIKSFLLGSVSRAVVEQCERPVLVVHPPPGEPEEPA